MLRQIVGWSMLALAVLQILGSVILNDGTVGTSGKPVGRVLGLYATFVQGMAWWYLVYGG